MHIHTSYIPVRMVWGGGALVEVLPRGWSVTHKGFAGREQDIIIV